MIEINFDTTGWCEHFWANLVWPALYLAIFAGLVKFTLYAATTLYVSGTANQWVLVIGPDGKKKQAAVGWKGFRKPYD